MHLLQIKTRLTYRVHGSTSWVQPWRLRRGKYLYVRYAWADNPEGTNLYNKEGLPAPPFEATIQ